MPAMVMVIVGFVAGLFTMTIVSIYKWCLEYFNGFN
jgi:hypothetical protein